MYAVIETGGKQYQVSVGDKIKVEKVITYKYKSKKNERTKKGHRQPYTFVEILSIA